MRIASASRPASVRPTRAPNPTVERERVEQIYETKRTAPRAEDAAAGAGVYEATFYVLDSPHAAAKRAYSLRTAPRLGARVDISV